MRIPITVFINDRPSAPPASAARAISPMAVTLGVNLMKIGIVTAALIAAVSFSTYSG